jgi:hypothetical protein
VALLAANERERARIGKKKRLQIRAEGGDEAEQLAIGQIQNGDLTARDTKDAKEEPGKRPH